MAYLHPRRLLHSLPRNARQRSFLLCQSRRAFSRCPSTMAIHVTPKVSLFDEKIRIGAQGLPVKAKVTVHASTRQSWKREPVEFASCSHHVTSDEGTLDLSKDASVGGSYTGLDPMGLFWSLKPSPAGPQNIRMVVRNGDKPVQYTLSVYHDHLSLDDLVSADPVHKPVYSTPVTRLKTAQGVRRITVTEGSVRGTLFLPPGDGPHPGVIDMFGTSGGLMDLRAGLLASRGFTVLALPFFAYKDLPAKLKDVTYDYFEESISWFSSHEAVKDDGIGVIAQSMGGALALIMAWKNPQVKAVVPINATPFYLLHDLRRKDGTLVKKGVPMDKRFMEETDLGSTIKMCFPHTQEYYIPVWETSVAHILTLMSDEDNIVDHKLADVFYHLYPENKRHLVEAVHYPGSGHLLEPPYSPHCSHCISPSVDMDGINFAWGGNPADHAAAQEDSWKRILKFFKTHLLN